MPPARRLLRAACPIGRAVNRHTSRRDLLGCVFFWDATWDGQRFVMPVPQGANSAASYRVVLTWPACLNR